MAACAGARHPSAGKRPSHEQRRQRGRNRAPGRAGRRTRQGGDPAPSRSTSSGSGRMAVTRYRAGHGAAVVRGHPAPRRPGLGLGGPGLPGLGVRVPGAGGDRRRHRAAAQPHQPTRRSRSCSACWWWPASAWASLAGSVAACSRRPRSAGCSRCWLRTAWGWAMASWPRPWAWRSAGCRGDGGGGVVAGFLLGGLAGLGGMLALGLSRTARLPFGPWLVGALLGVLVGGEVAGWFQASSLGAR